eukprot:scaffold17350_cov103-Isochrysis_galbana.AAC.3
MALAALYQRLGFVPAEVDTAPIASALEAALPDVLNASVSQLNFKSVVDKLGDVMYKYRFSLPPFYIAIIRCLGVLEGVALQVDSDFAIIKSAYPFIASRLLTDKSPQLQSVGAPDPHHYNITPNHPPTPHSTSAPTAPSPHAPHPQNSKTKSPTRLKEITRHIDRSLLVRMHRIRSRTTTTKLKRESRPDPPAFQTHCGPRCPSHTSRRAAGEGRVLSGG